MTIHTSVEANERVYPGPKVPAVAICLDGCEPEYLDVAIARGLMPTLQKMRAEGTDKLAHSVIPSFTNPNNLSIATGRPPVVHGICGNYLIDPDTGELIDGVGWMQEVRKLRANRPRWDDQPITPREPRDTAEAVPAKPWEAG